LVKPDTPLGRLEPQKIDTMEKRFETRYQTLEYLTQIMQSGDQGIRLMAQVDALIDELEEAWQTENEAHLELVKEKAKAFAALAQKP
jgi:rubrerythrin